MKYTVFICKMSGDIFQEIKYNDFNDLSDQLRLMLINNDSDISIQLLINNEFLNIFYNINGLILAKLDKNNISIVFNNKKLLYCLGEVTQNLIFLYKLKQVSIFLKIPIFLKDENRICL